MKIKTNNKQLTNKLKNEKNILEGAFFVEKLQKTGLNGEKIEKSNPYPRQEGGRWGKKSIYETI